MRIPDAPPASGIDIPLRASFAVVRGLPLVAVAHNNASPALTLFADRVEWRVIRRRAVPFAELDLVDARISLGTRSIVLASRGSTLAFSGHVGDEERLVALLRFFEARGLPLTARARGILAAAGPPTR